MRTSLNLAIRASILLVAVWNPAPVRAQTVAPSPFRAWNPSTARPIHESANGIRGWPFAIDSSRTYLLAELIDIAEEHNPETRVAWEGARSQLAQSGVAHSELFPALVMVVLAQAERDEVLFGDRFFRQTVFSRETALDLNYTVFDSGARAGRIEAAKFEALAANFAFNDTHCNVIYQVERAYYRLQNAIGQEDAARASLANARTVQQSAEDRLKNGLATLPDVLEARSASAQARSTIWKSYLA
jgi:outer membrane protein TolC